MQNRRRYLQHTANVGLESRVHKELLEINKKKDKESTTRCFAKEKTYIVSKHRKMPNFIRNQEKAN